MHTRFVIFQETHMLNSRLKLALRPNGAGVQDWETAFKTPRPLIYTTKVAKYFEK